MIQKNNMVYAMTNSPEKNEIMAYRRSPDGVLTFMQAYATGGSGSNEQKVDPLSSQGSLIVSKDKQMLFALNAGNHTISSFTIAEDGALHLQSVQPTQGKKPNSIALFANLLYVSNSEADAHSSTNITGFRIHRDALLTPLPGSTRMLSTPNAIPACIVFNICGSILFVSELSTNTIGVYSLREDGTLEKGKFYKAAGLGPFGAAPLCNGALLVTEAMSGAVSSYHTRNRGDLYTICPSVANGQKATCWISVEKQECYAYTSNAGSSSISVYRISKDGSIMFEKNVAAIPAGNVAPIDSCISGDNHNLYVLNGDKGSISVFTIMPGGNLKFIQLFSDTLLPSIGSQGIVAL